MDRNKNEKFQKQKERLHWNPHQADINKLTVSLCGWKITLAKVSLFLHSGLGDFCSEFASLNSKLPKFKMSNYHIPKMNKLPQNTIRKLSKTFDIEEQIKSVRA